MTKYYNPMQAAPTCASAWLQAASYLAKHGDTFGLMLHIESPALFTKTDNAIISEVDAFLRQYKAFPISTVANTIFPSSLDDPDDRQQLYARYRRLYPKIKAAVPDWGRYFDRMTRWKPERPTKSKSTDASQPDNINQLEDLIENLLKYGPAGDKDDVANMYEMTLFNPEKDRKKYYGRQCLSFIELKPEFDDGVGRLHMMAVYRSHFYMSKTLGNLIGLSKLQQFIAREAKTAVGTLTIQSTHATLDGGDRNEKRCTQSWGVTAAKALVKRCEVLASPAQASEETPS